MQSVLWVLGELAPALFKINLKTTAALPTVLVLSGHPVDSWLTQPVSLFSRAVTVGVGVCGPDGGSQLTPAEMPPGRKPGTHFGDIAHLVPHTQQRVQWDRKLSGSYWETSLFQ